jgi:hypothetical protein
MKMRDQVIDEIRRLPAERVVLVSELLSVLNQPAGVDRLQPRRGGSDARDRPEVQVRKALSGVKAEMSDDIAAGRDDRV